MNHDRRHPLVGDLLRETERDLPTTPQETRVEIGLLVAEDFEEHRQLCDERLAGLRVHLRARQDTVDVVDDLGVL